VCRWRGEGRDWRIAYGWRGLTLRKVNEHEVSAATRPQSAARSVRLRHPSPCRGSTQVRRRPGGLTPMA